jgi:hypothetical protein
MQDARAALRFQQGRMTGGRAGVRMGRAAFIAAPCRPPAALAPSVRGLTVRRLPLLCTSLV